MAKSKFPKFSEVQAKADFEAILKHYAIEFSRKGEELLCCCPFHEEKTPSCFVNPKKRLFKCFGCGAGGNAIEFVRLKEDLASSGSDLSKAAEIILAVSGASLDNIEDVVSSQLTGTRAGNGSEIAKKRKDVEAGDAQQQNEPLGFRLEIELGNAFLQSRGIDRAAEELFGLGLAKRGTMAGRIVIPIHNARGELVAYCGRYAGEVLPEGEPRYKFPKKFNKGIELFNLHRAVMLNKDYVVLVEGFWSAIRLHMLGIPAVAAMGAHTRKPQLALMIHAGFKRAYIIMDGDPAGRLGAEKAVIELAGQMLVRRIDLPEGIKPDTMGQEWIELLV